MNVDDVDAYHAIYFPHDSPIALRVVCEKKTLNHPGCLRSSWTQLSLPRHDLPVHLCGLLVYPVYPLFVVTGDLDTVWYSEDYRLHHPGPTRGGMFMAPWMRRKRGTWSPSPKRARCSSVLEERNAERRTAITCLHDYIYIYIYIYIDMHTYADESSNPQIKNQIEEYMFLSNSGSFSLPSFWLLYTICDYIYIHRHADFIAKKKSTKNPFFWFKHSSGVLAPCMNILMMCTCIQQTPRFDQIYELWKSLAFYPLVN